MKPFNTTTLYRTENYLIRTRLRNFGHVCHRPHVRVTWTVFRGRQSTTESVTGQGRFEGYVVREERTECRKVRECV